MNELTLPELVWGKSRAPLLWILVMGGREYIMVQFPPLDPESVLVGAHHGCQKANSWHSLHIQVFNIETHDDNSVGICKCAALLEVLCMHCLCNSP